MAPASKAWRPIVNTMYLFNGRLQTTYSVHKGSWSLAVEISSKYPFKGSLLSKYREKVTRQQVPKLFIFLSMF